MQAWIPVVSSRLYFWKSVFSFQVDSILKWRVYIKLKVSWLRAFLWCMSQTSRDRVNSRRVRTHEKNSGDAVRRLGTIIQSIFCAQSGASIRLTVWKWSGESRYPGAFPPVLENFCRAFSPGPTYRPWVSEDDCSLQVCRKFVKTEEQIWGKDGKCHICLVIYTPCFFLCESDPKGLDSSNNIDSRINITTFFNFPDMFRWYIHHLQCYIFWNRRWI